MKSQNPLQARHVSGWGQGKVGKGGGNCHFLNICHHVPSTVPDDSHKYTHPILILRTTLETMYHLNFVGKITEM